MPDLKPMLWPRSIALVGASPDKQIIRGRIVEAVSQSGFGGPVYPVSRSHREIGGMPAYPTVAELPEAVDLAIVTVPASVVPAALEACGEKGVRAVVIIASGFAEERGGTGAARQTDLATIAARYGMALCGPNAEGFLNAQLPLTATFSPAVFGVEGGLVPEGVPAGGIAVVSQSGGVGFAFYNRGRPKALRFSYVISTGNEAGLHTLDIVDYLIDDPHTQVVLVFLEGLRAAHGFSAVARKAARARKPLIIAKMGYSEAAALAARSHTASLAGSHRAYRAVFERYGVVTGEETEQMIDVAGAFAHFHDRLPRGRRVGILTPSGGAGVWLADACVKHGLEVPELDSETRRAIDALLPAYGASRNPVDVTAQVIFKLGFGPVLEILAASPAIDAVLVAGSMIHPDVIRADEENLRRIGKQIQKPVIFCAYTQAHPGAIRVLSQTGFPCLTDMGNAAAAVVAMADYREFLQRFDGDDHETPHPETVSEPVPLAADRTLCEHETKAVLARWGIDTGPGVLARDADEAVSAAAGFGTAVALKVQSPDISHKTEIGGVALGLETEGDIRTGFHRLMANAANHAPGAHLHGVLVEPMAGPGTEMILGVNRDPDFGPLLMMGMGGVLVEVLNDVVLTPVPVTAVEAARLLRKLKGYPLLEGVRGQPPADVAALAALIESLSRFAAAQGESLGELDLNPVIVHPEGQWVTIADALLITRPST